MFSVLTEPNYPKAAIGLEREAVTPRAAIQREWRKRQARGERLCRVLVSNRTLERMMNAGRISDDATDGEIAVELAAMIEERASLFP